MNATLRSLNLKEKTIIGEIENITNATINWVRENEQQLVTEARHVHRVSYK